MNNHLKKYFKKKMFKTTFSNQIRSFFATKTFKAPFQRLRDAAPRAAGAGARRPSIFSRCSQMLYRCQKKCYIYGWYIKCYIMLYLWNIYGYYFLILHGFHCLKGFERLPSTTLLARFNFSFFFFAASERMGLTNWINTLQWMIQIGFSGCLGNWWLKNTNKKPIKVVLGCNH